MASSSVAEGTQMSKPAYFIRHRDSARDAFDQKDEMFAERNVLLTELRTMFDWMAQEPEDGEGDRIHRASEDGTRRIALRHFKRRLPEIHRKFPLLASSFKRMDSDNNCWLDYEEFVNFCLKDQRLQAQLHRTMVVQVYGLERNGTRTYKDDPCYMCEMGTPIPLLPWEVAHVVEWRIEGLRLGRKGAPTVYAGMELRAGASIASPPFRAGGSCGFLRFWPKGYWTESARRRKANAPPGMEDLAAGGPCHLPGPDSWCCLGAYMPVGTHLSLRFRVAGARSERKECYWCGGTNAAQLWAPAERVPPEDILADAPFVVGIEVLRNFASPAGTTSPMKGSNRRQRPAMGKSIIDSGDVSGSFFLGQSRSLPALPKRHGKPLELPPKTKPLAPKLES